MHTQTKFMTQYMFNLLITIHNPLQKPKQAILIAYR